MSIRTVAFAAAAGCGIAGAPTALALLLIAVAVVLPYPAVVMANAVDRRSAPKPSRVVTVREPRTVRTHTG